MKKISEKSRTVPKNRKGDSLVPSGFVGYLEKVKMKGETLCTKFALALGGFSDVPKSGPISVRSVV